jgi:hypothetical protein
VTADLDPRTRTLVPFWGRVTVLPSPVDEEQLPSGLIVPIRHDESRDVCDRGIVLAVDQTYHDLSGPWAEYALRLTPGIVVHFRRGVRIGEAVVVDIDDILAYESE